MNGKPIAADVINDMTSELKQDLFGLNDNFPQRADNQSKNQLIRRNTIPLITTDNNNNNNSIGCQTDGNDLKSEVIVSKQRKNGEILKEKYLVKKKLMKALGIYVTSNQM